MEQFSRAYALAVASVADCSVDWTSVDRDSVDATLNRRTINTTVRSPKLDVQLKATAQDCVGASDIAFQLSIKNYEELRASNLSVPRILVVVVVPPDFNDWTTHSETELLLRRCGYWMSLRGEAAVSNAAKRSVRLPRQQVFDPLSLDAIFNRLASGGLP